MKRLLAMLLSAGMLLSATACGTAEETTYTVDSVNMTYVKTPLNVPSIVEKQQDSFTAAYGELGLGFSLVEMNKGSDQTAALASGDIQILNAVGGTSLIVSAANGADIKIIGMYCTSPEVFCLYASDESVQSPEDLRGKTIAGPKGSNLHELLAAYLATAGMSMEDVNFVSMDMNASFAALESGSVDCALQAGAAAYRCEQAGYSFVTNGKGLITGTILTATSQKFYDENPTLVDTFLQVQEEALTFIQEHHDEAMAMAAEETGLSLDVVEAMYPLFDFRSELTDEDLSALQETVRFLLDNGLIDNEVDMTGLVLER